MAEKFNDDAKRSNDIPGQKLAEDSMRILRIQRDSQIGGVEEGMKDYAREVKAIDTDFLKEELGFTTLEEVNKYKEKLISDHEEVSKNYAKNLAYAESLLGEQDSKIEEFKNIGIRTIHAAMAHSLTLGESARKIDNNLTGVINDEILNLSGNENFVEANNVQQVLENISEENKVKLNTLKTERVNLTQKLKTQEASLVKEGKIKVGEEASARQNRLIDLTEEIQKTQDAIATNREQSEIALNGLGIEQYTDGTLTVDSFDKQVENVRNFEVFMKDLSKSNPQKYSKMLALLAQKSKSIKHIKNYEQAIDLIVNKATRLKTVEGWAKKINLKTKPAEYYANILADLNETTTVIVEDNRQAIENREAFKNEEEVSQSYIDKLKEQDYNTLLKADQEILDSQEVSIQMPNKVEELEKERTEALSKVAPAIVIKETPIAEVEETTPNTEEINRLEKERDNKIFQESKPDLKLKLVASKDLVNSQDPIGNKEIQDVIKEKLKNLKQLIECL